ncbi:MAG: DUF4350 domain-containing protein, partial [Chloroflexota bacterium]
MSRRHLLSTMMVVAFLSTMLVMHLHPVRADFSVANESWNGLSEFAEVKDICTLESIARNRAAMATATIVVLGRDVTELDTLDAVSVLRSFAESGGTLVLLEDGHTGAGLLEQLELGVEVVGSPLLDPLHCYRDPALPRVYPPRAVEHGDHSLILNHGSWLRTGDRARVLLQSSFFAYGDTNGNGQYDENEPAGRLPVATVTPLGSGQVLVVADSSLLLNSMLEISDNLAWLESQCTEPMLLLQTTSSLPPRGSIYEEQ